MNPCLGGIALALLTTAAVHAVPSISQQPLSVATSAGRSASFSVVATGSGPLSYQWRRDGFNLPGGTSSFLSISSASQGDSGAYDVLVSDGQQAVPSNLALLRVSPANDAAVVLQDSIAPRLEGPANGRLVKPAMLPDGRFYVAGNLTSFQDQRRLGLTRCNADGTVDASYVPPAIDGQILCIAALSDGRLLIAGDFTTVGGVQSRGVARLNANGSLDRSFQVGTGFNVAYYGMRALAVAPDGSVFVSGLFSTYQGRPVLMLAKLNPAGELDPSFTRPDLASAPVDLALTPDGGLYIAGTYLRPVGSVSRNTQVLRLLPNGTVDSTFDMGTGVGSSGTVQHILRQADGKLLLSGYFENFSGSGISRLARVLEDGSVDRTFNPGLAINNSATALAQASTGDLIIGGNLTGVFPTQVVRLRLNGTRDSTFVPTGYNFVDDVATLPDGRVLVAGTNLTATGGGTQYFAGVEILDAAGRKTSFDARLRFPGAVRMMRHQLGGKLILAGDFTHFNGTAVGRVVRLNQDLTLDPTFRSGSGLNDAVVTGTMQPDGKILLIGFFTQAAGTAVSGFVRLNADGSVDSGFHGSETSVYAYPSAPTVLRDGRIIVLLDWFTAPNGFRVHAPDGTLLSTSPFGVGAPASVVAAASLPNGQVLFAGAFDTWNGVPKSHLARLNLDDSLDANFNTTSGVLRQVSKFDVEGRGAQSTGNVIVSAQSEAPYLLRLQPDGRRDLNFTAALSRSPNPDYIILADDRIFAWGTSVTATATQVTRLLPDGGTDPSFAIIGEASSDTAGHPYWVNAVVTDSGDIAAATVGGLLMRFAAVTRPFLTAPPVSAIRPAGETATFSVTAVGPGPLTYQWYYNRNPIAGATSATLTLPRVFSLHAGEYQVAVTNSYGTILSTPVTLTVDTSASSLVRLTNLSVRANLGPAPLIAGFVVAGSGKEILLRGIGPGLAQFSVTGAAADTKLVLYNGTTTVDQNDNWTGDAALVAAMKAVGAFPVLANSLDAMLLRSVEGAHTAQLSAGPSGGVALVEIYDTNPNPTLANRLTNVSARYHVGTGENILIAGLSISGSSSKTLLLRGVGPALTQFGVTDALVDPRLAVYSGVTLVAENNDWGGSPELTAVAAAVGAFPLNAASRDAALLLSLPAGSYTVQLSGNAGGNGEGLIEIYEVP